MADRGCVTPIAENSVVNRKPGLYKIGSCAKNPRKDHAFDSLVVDVFSKAYPRLLNEVLKKEPPLEKENYDAPKLELQGVPLSRILREIYQPFIAEPEKFSIAQ